MTRKQLEDNKTESADSEDTSNKTTKFTKKIQDKSVKKEAEEDHVDGDDTATVKPMVGGDPKTWAPDSTDEAEQPSKKSKKAK